MLYRVIKLSFLIIVSNIGTRDTVVEEIRDVVDNPRNLK